MNPTQSKRLLLSVAKAIKFDAGVTAHAVLPDVIAESAFSNPYHHVIVAPKGDTEVGLTILAHEAGHVATTRDYEATHPVRAGRTDLEFEASLWAFRHIRQHGGETTQKMEAFARWALKSYAIGDMNDGSLPPSEATKAFIRGSLDI
jgi:hypothetical protein